MELRHHARLLGRIAASAALVSAFSALSATAGHSTAQAASGTTCVAGQRTDLGPGSVASPITTGQILNGKAYVVTRAVTPPLLAVYDMATHKVTDNVDIPTGGGAWASTLQGTDLYIGMYYVADLYKFDTVSHQLTKVVSLPDGYIWDLTTSPDGKIFAGTYPSGKVWEYDPSNGQVTDLGVAAPGEAYVRSVAADDTTVYAGVGAHAHLVAIDRATGARQNILPPELATESFGYETVLTPDYIIGGTNPHGTLFVINKHDYSDYKVIRPPGMITIDSINVVGDNVYFSADGASSTYVYDYHLSTGELTTLPATQPGYYHDIYVNDGTMVGFSDYGYVWTYQLDSGAATVTDLQQAGMHARPEAPQSMIADDENTVYVGGHGGLAVHHLDSGTVQRVTVGGEPKAMALVQGKLYLAMYSSGELDMYDPKTGTVKQASVFGEDQIRPRDMRYDPSSGQLLIGTQPQYGQLGGALVQYDPRTGTQQVFRNVIPTQSISSVTSEHGIAYLGSEIYGGGGAAPEAKEAHLTAFDIATHQTLFDIVPVPGAPAIRHLATFDGLIYGSTNTGTLFVVDPTTKNVRVLVDKPGPANDELALTARDDAVYGASHDQLVRIDPHTFALQVIADGLHADPNAYPQLSNGGGCDMYTITGDDLLRVSIGSN